MSKNVDVAIVGAGPSGLFAAYELMNSGFNILVLEEDAQAGGAGGKSDGKLNFSPDIGFFLERLKMPYEDVKNGVDYVEDVFVKMVDAAKDELEEFKNLEFWENIYGTDETKISELKRKADQHGIEFISGKQRHMGTDKIGPFMNFFKEHLERNSVDFKMNYKVKKIDKKEEEFILNDEITSNYLIISPGRSGSLWCRERCRDLKAETLFGPVDIGVRLEFPASIYEPVEEVMYDAKFQFLSETDELVRTFCTNPNGFVDIEKPIRELKLINGHSQSREGKKSKNTNLAILTRTYLTAPLADTKEYAIGIAKLTNNLGGGKPLIQRYGDLKKKRRSTWKKLESKSCVEPTLKDVGPGDIRRAYPPAILDNIIEGIEKFELIIPGIAENWTLLYAPEIKLYDTIYNQNEYLELKEIKNLFVAGDASGVTRGIVPAAFSGILAARGIINKK